MNEYGELLSHFARVFGSSSDIHAILLIYRSVSSIFSVSIREVVTSSGMHNREYRMIDHVMHRHGVSYDRERLDSFCRKRGIRKLSLFGSILRDDFSPESDIDVLVEFQPGQRVNLLDMVDMEEELSDIMGGKKIDLRTPGDLHQRFRDMVLIEAEALCTHERE